MRYQEPVVGMAIPISLVRRIAECVRADIVNNENSSSRAEMLKNVKNEKALSLLDSVIIDHEAKAIIGDSLSDANLKKLLGSKRKKTVRKKQND
jgi:hypothetical protein